MTDLPPLPLRPGTSPFRVRGTVYRSFIEWLDTLAPGRFQESVAELPDPEVRAFFERPFGRFDWYDLLPLLPLSAAAARLHGMELLDFARWRSRLQAIEDTDGPLRLFLKVASPALVATRLPRLAGHYFDFGKDESEKLGNEHVQVRRTGLPRLIAEWFVATSGTFIETVLEGTGAREPKVAVRSIEAAGEEQGVELVTLTLDITWKAK